MVGDLSLFACYQNLSPPISRGGWVGVYFDWCMRGCLHDNSATVIPGRDEKLHRVYIKPCLLGCESYSAAKLMKL